MSLLEQGSIVDLAVAVKKSKLEARISNMEKKKMGFSGFFIFVVSSRVLLNSKLSFCYRTMLSS